MNLLFLVYLTKLENNHSNSLVNKQFGKWVAIFWQLTIQQHRVPIFVNLLSSRIVDFLLVVGLLFNLYQAQLANCWR